MASEAAPPPVGAPSSDDRTIALLTHLSGIVLGFIVPLIIWLINKDKPEKSFVTDQAKEALNFQITVTIAGFAVAIISVVTLGLGAILYLAFVVAIVFQIMGAVAANRGEAYRYPLNWRLVH